MTGKPHGADSSRINIVQRLLSLMQKARCLTQASQNTA